MLDLDSRVLSSEPISVSQNPDIVAIPGEVIEAHDIAEVPAVAAVSDIPSWITEPSTEHSAWPGAVPLVSGPLPASTTATGATAASATTSVAAAGSTTTGPIAGAPDVARQTPAGSVAAEPGASAAGLPAADFTTAGDPPSGPGQSDLPTRRPGNTGLAWGENALAGGRWAGFPLNRTSTGQPASGAGRPEDMRTDAWAPVAPAAPRPADPPTTAPADARATRARATGTGTTGASPSGAVPASADDAKVSAASQPAESGPPPADALAGPASASSTKAEQVRPAEAAPAELEGLPVRVRQANLAPQLKKATPPVQPGADEPTAPAPEAARNTMAAVQLGWQRGRSVAEPTEPV